MGLSAQINISGLVMDHKTGEPLPFVNIAISGTTMGTISSLDGDFALNVPDNMAGRQLTFSSVGYQPVTQNIAESNKNQKFNINLQPIDFKINEVVITDKSEAGRKLVRSVIETIGSRYVDRDFAYAGYYRSQVSLPDGKVLMSDYQFNAYDEAGYSQGAADNAFKALNYKFHSVKRDFKVYDYESGMNYFDITSAFDIVRYQLGVMNPFTLMDFDFRIKSETSDRVEVQFNCENPRLINTGVMGARKFSGTISILKKENIVEWAEYQMEVQNLSDLGLSVMDVTVRNTATITCKVLYKKYLDKYAVSSIQSTIEIAGGKKIEDEISINSLNYKVPGRINGKVFYTR